ncbi:hypothetical protein AJ80_07498 [Polytolypa hystricis UAMH7299]|uniref:Extradiol ring-cleavage dioxygenase class III enzyme subunit B domain-containing protein n=1 Tax=Polytolypa hystricis (strain UAMH7299) TaxID=1447883 RepID=A0A2B7XPI1_POLH7|nr:hypothetical protein AJ80_07498 [Polytolypa hystricis UAMH7299]
MSRPSTTPSRTRTASTTTTSTSNTISLLLLSVLIAILASFAILSPASITTRARAALQYFPFTRGYSGLSTSVSAGNSATAATATATTAAGVMMAKTPIYFLSHGGPNIMYQNDHPAFRKLQEIGREITQKVKPRAVVVFSAHWQGTRDTVQVNQAPLTELIYDFYGFPGHYYKEKYPNVGSKEVAQKVISAIQDAGMKAEGVKRGLDHGVWASFKCAFDPEENPLNVPIVQVSLFDTEDPVQHYKLGQAVSKLRDENIQIIVSGMAVHNLRDLQFTRGQTKPMPYTVSFDEALKDAVVTAPEQREKALVDLLKRGDARQAHPTFDHLLPIHVGAGAAGEDMGDRLFTLKEGSMSWAQFRFGKVAANL